MSLDNEVQQEAAKRGILGRMKDTISDYVSTTGQKAKTAAAIATVLAAGVVGGRAEGATVLDDLPTSSTPVATFAAPTNVTFTGGDGIGEGKYVATSADKIFVYDGFNTTPDMTLTTPLSNISGAAYRGRDNGDIFLTLSNGTSLYEGRISGSSFNIDSIISLSGITSDTTDVDYGLGSYFVPTQNDGVRRVESDGSATEISSQNGFGAYDILESKLDEQGNPVYDSPAGQFDGTFFQNLLSDGTPTGASAGTNFNNFADVKGIAYFDNDNDPTNGINGGMALIQDFGYIDVHNPLPFQQNIVDVGTPVPEPMSITMGLVGLGGLALMRGRRDQKYQPTE